MRSTVSLIAAGSLLAALASAQTTHYTVTDLGTFGGTFSIAFGINSAGRVAGSANDSAEHARPFLSGIAKFDIGTLGGPNAQPGGPNGKNETSILSETSKTDPFGEDFCGFGNHLICLGAFWNGVMTPLPTLGGTNAMAFGLNNRDQIIGVAETTTKDKSCPSPQIFDFEAVVWGPGGQIQALPPLPGDTVGFTLAINDLGQVAGVSGTCANTTISAVGLVNGPHAVLWENGSATDLGNLGGKMVGKGGAINNRGEVAGLSDLPDGSIHSFLWTRDTGMKDLGALGGDVLGDPAGINNSTQVVGGSCDADGNCRAFLWQNKVLSDLNDLIPTNSPLYLMYALGINDAGEIVGFALENSTGEVHAYLATPIPVKAGAHSAMPSAQPETRPQALPENVRQMLRKRLPFGRLGASPR